MVEARSCTNCDRFPFCDYQSKCKFCNYRILNNQVEDYWIKRQNKEVKKCQN